MNLPNTLTVARIFLVPVLVSVLLTKFEGRLVVGLPVELVAAAIFGIASLTDWLDGYLARRRKQVTTLGQILDPLADKLLISATLISLVQLDLVQSWMVGVIISREIAVTGLRNLAYSRGLTMPASGLGKLKMASQVTAILLLLLGWERAPLLVTLGQGTMWIVVITALVSALDYYQDFQRAMNSRDAKVADFEAAKSARG
ncbi:MAG: CDP-diacylglycerol--glycerol-3-phosphate 3-phosphatidyltransferase, partial [Vicinamibacterales bacterium]